MAKKDKTEELIRLGNFTIYGIRDAYGHQTMMDIRSASKNWLMRFDESTFMFGLIKSVVGMNPNKTETKQWYSYLQALVNVEYQFGTGGVAVEILVEIGKMLISYAGKQAKEAKSPTKKQEKETLADMKREYEMKEELKKAEENGQNEEN
jgi:hypothetical protein